MSVDRKEEESEVNHERWLVSYADFITLLFAFFAVLYATSEQNLEKTREFQESIKRFLIKAGAFGESGQKINQGDLHNTVIAPPIETFRREKFESADIMNQTEQFIESQLSPEMRKKYLVDVVSDEWGVRIIVRADAVFAKDNARFREDAMEFVQTLGRLISKSKRKVLIEGHVAQGETGGERSTWDFASARAVNFLRFLQRSQNLPPQQLAAVSFADSKPLFQRSRLRDNSRIELVLMNDDLSF